jgi:endoglucanase
MWQRRGIPSYGRHALRGSCSIALAISLLVSNSLWSQSPSGFELLGRGVNYGNMLESPREGEWGARYNDEYPRLVKAAGFDSVRIPVRWSSRTAKLEPFRIDPEFMNRVKSVVEQNLSQGLKVVVNDHHFDVLYDDPALQRSRFLTVWRQIAEQFKDADERLFFELLNEPHGKLSGEAWNDLLDATLREIRVRHPNRWVIVGPDEWNSVKKLEQLKLPENDRRLIVTVHYYLPFAFTHQGAEWTQPLLPVGNAWTGTPAETAEIERDFARVAEWAKKNRRPIYVGEFGAYHRADMESRTRWTRQIRKTCEASGFAWAYWELAAGFGVLDPDTKRWRQSLLDALIEK